MAKIEIEVPGNAIDARATKELLQKIANLPADQIERISEVVNNPKGLKMLKEKWGFIKTFM